VRPRAGNGLGVLPTTMTQIGESRTERSTMLTAKLSHRLASLILLAILTMLSPLRSGKCLALDTSLSDHPHVTPHTSLSPRRAPLPFPPVTIGSTLHPLPAIASHSTPLPHNKASFPALQTSIPNLPLSCSTPRLLHRTSYSLHSTTDLSLSPHPTPHSPHPTPHTPLPTL